jgi:hypothetical protein
MEISVLIHLVRPPGNNKVMVITNHFVTTLKQKKKGVTKGQNYNSPNCGKNISI